MMKRFSLQDFPLENKTVFVRVDYNVPLQNGRVMDDVKIKASLPTLRYLLSKNCKIVLGTHLGRPDGKAAEGLKLDPVAKELQQLLPKERIVKLNDCIGREIKEQIQKGRPKTIFMLENLRFYPEEEQNSPIFAHALADLTDIYINDAFAVAHRKHASVDAITEFVPALAGILLETELMQLGQALKPKRPAVWILGGAKLNKIDLIKQALKKADYILIGGALAFSFLKAKGIPVGMSKTDHQSVAVAKKILKKRTAKKIVLPLDFVATTTFSAKANSEIVPYNQIQPHQISLDLGPGTVELFKHYLRKAHTIFWNGPLGYFEWAQFSRSTKEIGRFLGTLTATTLCGGGETAEALRKFHLQHGITYLSTGGGAALAFLSGEKLPAITALERNYRKFKKILRKKRRRLLE